MPVTFGIRRLAPLWGAFRDLHPQVRLDITLADRVVDLVEEGYDLAIRIGTLSSSSLIGRRLAVERLRVCASPEYLAAHGTPSHPAELSEHSVVAYSYWSAGDEWSLQGAEGPISVRTRPCISTNNGDTCRAAALAGQGIVLLPDFIVGDDIEAGRLIELLPDYTAGELGVHAVYPSRRHVAPKIRAMLAFLSEQLGGADAAERTRQSTRIPR